MWWKHTTVLIFIRHSSQHITMATSRTTLECVIFSELSTQNRNLIRVVLCTLWSLKLARDDAIVWEQLRLYENENKRSIPPYTIHIRNNKAQIQYIVNTYDISQRSSQQKIILNWPYMNDVVTNVHKYTQRVFWEKQSKIILI